ncbi:MAG: hypothetical protein KBD31_01650 [Proteobacteria bacterium]|nr:hypothetical protein [Pseudomonadota bacterium]
MKVYKKFFKIAGFCITSCFLLANEQTNDNSNKIDFNTVYHESNMNVSCQNVRDEYKKRYWNEESKSYNFDKCPVYKALQEYLGRYGMNNKPGYIYFKGQVISADTVLMKSPSYRLDIQKEIKKQNFVIMQIQNGTGNDNKNGGTYASISVDKDTPYHICHLHFCFATSMYLTYETMLNMPKKYKDVTTFKANDPFFLTKEQNKNKKDKPNVKVKKKH